MKTEKYHFLVDVKPQLGLLAAQLPNVQYIETHKTLVVPFDLTFSFLCPELKQTPSAADLALRKAVASHLDRRLDIHVLNVRKASQPEPWPRPVLASNGQCYTRRSDQSFQSKFFRALNTQICRLFSSTRSPLSGANRLEPQAASVSGKNETNNYR